MFLYLLFIVFTWTLIFLSLKLLKDFALTSIFGLLLSFLGIYGFSAGYAQEPLFYAFSISHIFIGLYFVVRSSIDLITKNNKWKKPQWEDLGEWLKKNKKRK